MSAALNRRDVVNTVLRDRPDDLLAVAGLGSSAWDLSAAGDHAGNFCFIGAMGQALPFALGLALAQRERPVVLFTGDGDLLMSLGCLATAAREAPRNLSIVVLDNEVYGETGGQPTATAGRTDLAAIARGAGLGNVHDVRAADELAAVAAAVVACDGPYFACVKVLAERLPTVFPYSFDGVTAINRFREFVVT